MYIPGYLTTSGAQHGANSEYLAYWPDWVLFRDIMRGGRSFVEKYVQRFKYESQTEFNDRKAMTPNSGFAKAAIIDVRNSIYQRLDTVRRNGGDTKYQDSIRGKLGGVDLRGSTMNYFMGTKVLTELVFMGKVGIYVDCPKCDIPRQYRTQANTKNIHPYVYTYATEDILDWDYYLKDTERKLRMLRLRVVKDTQAAFRGYIEPQTVEYRTYELNTDGAVVLTVEQLDQNEKLVVVYQSTLESSEIPFVILEMDSPLLTDIAYHQIALTNLESGNVNYAYRANTIMYVEEYDPLGLSHIQGAEAMEEALSEDAATGDDPTRNGDNPTVVKVGATDGKLIPKGLKYPEFINPSSEPLKASREYMDDLKRDIRALINLAVSNAQARFASAESKQMDNEGLQAGLAAIGFMLEQGEREVNTIWQDYANCPPITVHYPQRYSLRSDEDRQKEAKSLLEMSNAVPSKQYRMESFKEAATIMFGAKIKDETLDTIIKEIEESPWPTANPDQIRSDVEVGLVSREGGSLARGYPEEEAKKAQKEQKERDAAKMKAQTPPGFNASARGVDDDSEGAEDEKEESQSPENNDGKRAVRGEDNASRKTRRDKRG